MYLFGRPLWRLMKYSPGERGKESLKRKQDPNSSDEEDDQDVKRHEIE
jgi:hypothetical protein